MELCNYGVVELWVYDSCGVVRLCNCGIVEL